jgi:hypothetical protein
MSEAASGRSERGARRALRRACALSGGAVLALWLALCPAATLAHDEAEIDGYDVNVGLVGEPVFVGDETGMELRVSRDGAPVAGLEETLAVEVRYGESVRQLALQPEGDGYVAPFIPTQAGPYAFHVTGTIEGAAVDVTLAPSEAGFEEVLDRAAGEFPGTLPTAAELAALVSGEGGAAAPTTAALALGAIGFVTGITALGVALGGRRRRDA